jgi:cysteine desulfurase family protein (TIGR01976 family)
LDGPGGSQVVAAAIDAMAGYMQSGGANLHGRFPSSRETEEHILEARKAMADLLGVHHREIAFGANTTTLAFSVARALGRDWGPGDEMVVTELDHRGNVDPWLAMAGEKGVSIRWIKVDTGTFTLDLADLESIVNEKTVLVAVGLASNAVGTVNQVERIAARAKEVGALVAVDAVHAVPHFSVDRDQLGADILFCSVYKFFGPHIGVAAIKEEVFERLAAYKLAPAPGYIPDKLETGTQNHEGIAGIRPAVEFIASLGTGATRRQQILSGYQRIEEYENRLAGKIRENLAGLPGLKLYQAPEHIRKTPTIAFTVAGRPPAGVCRRVVEDYAIFIADGDFYASTLADKLGINKDGGWVRAGLAPYNSEEEADNFIEAVKAVVRSRG